jgi:hypothetical protein
MKRLPLWTTAAACAWLATGTSGTAVADDAQSWHWKYVTQTANGPPLAAQSTVTIGANKVHMTYSVPLQKRQVVIESCDADLRDVVDATTVRNAGTTYFLIRFSPSHGAVCGSGRRPAVALPADDEQYVSNVAAAVTRSVHGSTAKAQSAAIVARAAAPSARPSPLGQAKPSPAPASKPTAAPTATPLPTAKPTSTASAMPAATPAPTPSPSPSPTPARPALHDWVENDGLFWFVRMRNVGGVPLTPEGEVFNCRNVGTGCGPFMHTLLEPGGTATVAAIAAANRNTAPVFEYRFSVTDGAQTLAGAGSSTKRPPHGSPRMSAGDLRSAQALALGQLGAPNAAPSAPVIPARLVKRGSSRLAIGETGTAIVRVTIAEDGTPQEASIVSITNKALTAAAIETAVSSTYVPATQNGRAIAAKYIATFSFDGQDPALSSIPVWKRPPSPTPAASGSPAQGPASSASGSPGASPPR